MTKLFWLALAYIIVCVIGLLIFVPGIWTVLLAFVGIVGFIAAFTYVVMYITEGPWR